MGIFDDIKAKGAAYRLTEEALYAEALKEIESGQRRDGIWAKAMSESNMEVGMAGAKYIKMRVQSLKDEVTVFIASQKLEAHTQKSIASPTVSSQTGLVVKEADDAHSITSMILHALRTLVLLLSLLIVVPFIVWLFL